MRALLLVIALSFSSIILAADRYSCTPLSGAENFKDSNLYFIDHKGKQATLTDAHNNEHTWDYDVFYARKGYGFRAIRSVRQGSSPMTSMASIAIGGTLYLMSFEAGSIKALVTYTNALKDGDIGSMRLKCTK